MSLRAMDKWDRSGGQGVLRQDGVLEGQSSLQDSSGTRAISDQVGVAVAFQE